MTVLPARLAVLCAWLSLTATTAAFAESRAIVKTEGDISSPGGQLYQQRCAMCHDQTLERVPPRVTMIAMTPEYVERILTKGAMQAQASGLTAEQIKLVATFVTGGKPFGSSPEPDAQANLCKNPPAPLRLSDKDWNGWGKSFDNTRFNPQPGLKAADVPKLKVKWVFAMPGRAVYGQPVVVGGRLFVGSMDGHLFSLDAKTGCTHWSFTADAALKTAVSIGKSATGEFVAYFVDEKTTAYAVNADSGQLLWKTKAEGHPLAHSVGAPSLYAGRLYIPLAAQEELASRQSSYECCTFRGNLVALDAANGKELWRTYTIEEPVRLLTAPGERKLFGPAGAALWNALIIDPAKGYIYAGTGNSYTGAPVHTTNALVGFDLATGSLRWVKQVLTQDNWTAGCWKPQNENCPPAEGRDNDFASAPLLRTLPGGQRVLVGALKTGHLYGVDPDHEGRILWEMLPLGEDPPGTQADVSMSGIQFGMAADRDNVYAARIGQGGVTAISLKTGEKVWHTPSPNVGCTWGTTACTNSQANAPIAIPGAVFSSAIDGHIRAYSSKDGRIVWDFDTAAQPYQAVNGATATGGSMSGSSQIIAGGMLYVNSGYIFPHAGNALIAFSVNGR